MDGIEKTILKNQVVFFFIFAISLVKESFFQFYLNIYNKKDCTKNIQKDENRSSGRTSRNLSEL